MTQLRVFVALNLCSLGGSPRCSSNSGNHVLQISLMNHGSDRNCTCESVTPIWRLKLAMYSAPASELISPFPTTYNWSHSFGILPCIPTCTILRSEEHTSELQSLRHL